MLINKRQVCRTATGLLLASLLLPVAGFSKDKKKDPEEIGNRDVGKGVNFYSIEKEIALGKRSRRKSSGKPASSTTR
jgi:hypothetical protein